MQYCFYLLFNIILAATLFYATHDPTKDYVPVPSGNSCMNEAEGSRIFCAQCVYRENKGLKQKGYLVQTEGKTSILKIGRSSNVLTCNDYLQIPNYQKTRNSNAAIQPENLKPIQEILAEEAAIFMTKSDKTQIISPQYDAFIIYRWFEITQQKTSTVKFPNIDQINKVFNLFIYVVNGIILLVIVLFLYNKSSFSHLKSKNLIIAGVYFAIIQVLTFSVYPHDAILDWIRILFFLMLLMRVDVNKMIIAFSVLLGVIANYFSILSYTYLLFVLIALFQRGNNDHEIRQIWNFIVLSMFAYTANQLWWDYSYAEIADIHCRLIELACLTLTPLGLLLIRDQKYVGFDLYKPNEPKKHAISLSGFEEVEEDDES